MIGATLSGHFIPGGEGSIFVVRRGPAQGGHCVLIVPPFAEEMNKTRRMASLVALELADRGITTVMPDLYGTGDSAGDFSEADWNIWRHDLSSVVEWCESTHGPVFGMVAVRLGCALACDETVLSSMAHLRRTVFWQPVLDGSRFLNQFLRLRVAASMANGVSESVSALRSELSRLGEVEIAGYRISHRLAEQLDQLRTPAPLPGSLVDLSWFELVRGGSDAVSPGSASLVEASVAAGLPVRVELVRGEPFWSSTEVVTNESLVSATCAYLLGDRRPATESAA